MPVNCRMPCWNRGSSAWVRYKKKYCNGMAVSYGTIITGWPTITGMVPVKNNVSLQFIVVLSCLCVTGAASFAQTPEEQKVWEVRSARSAKPTRKPKAEVLLKQREARKADPMAWVRTLHPMTEGGWQFRAVAPDGSWAAFRTEHQLKRSGLLGHGLAAAGVSRKRSATATATFSSVRGEDRVRLQ